MPILVLTLCALMINSVALAQAPVGRMLVQACLSQQGGNPNAVPACNCYASQMLSVADQMDVSEMLEGRITPRMNQMDPVAKGRCGLR
jgi:hypothetical protein